MKTLLTTTALVALLGAAPGFAQDPAPTTDRPTANDVIPDPNMPAPAANPDATTPDSSAAPMDKTQDQVQTPAPADAIAATAPAADKFLTVQTSSQWLASSLIGSTVYNSADENLGDINDVVFDERGSVEAVIIGVGGFLGIGEKSVAVSFSTLQKTADPNGNAKFILNATKEELDAAPAFAMLTDKPRVDTQPPADAMTPAPGDAMAPEPAPAPQPAPAQ